MKCVATIPIIDVIPTATATSLRGAVKWSVSPMAWHCSQLPCRLTGGYSPLRSTRSSFRSGRYDRRIWDAAAHCGRTMFATTAVTAEHRGRCSLRVQMILVQPKSRTNQGDGPYVVLSSTSSAPTKSLLHLPNHREDLSASQARHLPYKGRQDDAERNKAE